LASAAEKAAWMEMDVEASFRETDRAKPSINEDWASCMSTSQSAGDRPAAFCSCHQFLVNTVLNCGGNDIQCIGQRLP